MDEMGGGRARHDDKQSGGGTQYAHWYHNSPNSSTNTAANRGVTNHGLRKKVYVDNLQHLAGLLKFVIDDHSGDGWLRLSSHLLLH
jgi:hypothetical protein